MKLMVLGASGAVGQHVVEQALSSSDFSRVIAPTRQAMAPNDKLENPVIDYEALTGKEPWWQVDAVVCCLGTTHKLAGSAQQFFRVDHDYVMMAAEFAQAQGCKAFVYNSSVGANAKSWVSNYTRTKGLVEQHLQEAGFKSLTIVRPPLLAGAKRPDTRPGEDFGLLLNSLFGFLLPASLRAAHVSDVARCLLREVVKQTAGVHIFEPRDV